MAFPSTREKITDAAMTIVREKGVIKLTLDEAARVSGLSKGGVLYHFKSKDDLVRGMIERLVTLMDEEDHAHYAEEPAGPYRWLRASLRTAFSAQGPACDSVGGALLAAITVNPELMSTVHDKYAEWVERALSDSPNPMVALLVSMALDGRYFERMMGLKLCDDDQQEEVRKFILDLLKKEDGAV